MTSGVAFYDSAYKQGQIDAINGQIKFRLKNNKDGSAEWVNKKGNKND